MKSFEILGGRKLDGKIRIESAKNSVLALLAASFLSDEQVVIKDCPKIQDVISMVEILSYLGVKTHFEDNALVIDAKGRKGFSVPENLTKKLRSSIYFMGALCGVYKKAEMHLPGGCKIGERPIDLHILAMQNLGYKTKLVNNKIKCIKKTSLDSIIQFSFPSVGATVNAILASVLGQNRTVILNGAKEPEIVDLAEFVNSMGGKINGAGTSRIEIYGVKKLGGTVYRPIPDRIELGTYILASAITGGKTQFENANLKNIKILIDKILNNSCHISIKNDIMYAKFQSLAKGVCLTTAPYPGFPTDLQPQVSAYLSVCDGCSLIKETLFERRFSFASELNKMGADITVKNDRAFIRGVKNLHGDKVTAFDLRSGASLVIAGLKAEGKTLIDGVEHIERGYLDLPKKLSMLGADVKLIT